MQKDFFHIPSKYSGDVKIFTATTGTNLQGFQIWQKPRGATFVYMLTIAGGGGGGGGVSKTSGSNGGGGGGGACSGITRFNCPAVFLPDTLYIQVGGGGVGGAGSGAGSAGLNSFILTSKTAVLPNIICYSGVNAPGGGGAGTTFAGGSAGSVPTIAVTQPFNAVGEWFTNVGLVGIVGGIQTGAVGGDITAWGTIPLSPGASGAGCVTANFAGGNQTVTALLDIGSQGYYPTGTGNLVLGGTAAGIGVDGGGGVNKITPLFCSGGSGGGSNNAGVAGDGGNGGYGCGGGGGGAGLTGGNGGNGGSGLVVIITM